VPTKRVFEELLLKVDRIRRGEIRDAKTLAAWLLLSRRGSGDQR